MSAFPLWPFSFCAVKRIRPQFSRALVKKNAREGISWADVEEIASVITRRDKSEFPRVYADMLHRTLISLSDNPSRSRNAFRTVPEG